MFNIGKFFDEVICDVVPMEAGHLLLGRPWEYDRDATHYGKSNKYLFFINNKKFSLNPLTPSEVYECQVHFKKEFDKRKLENKIESDKAAMDRKFENATNVRKAELGSKPKQKSVSSNSSSPKLLHVHEEEEIEEIVRKSSLTKRSLCVHVKNDK